MVKLTYADSVKMYPGNSFLHSILHAWHGYSFYESQNDTSVKKQFIWSNSLIKTGGTPFKYSNGDSELLTVEQLWGKGHFKTFEEAAQEFGITSWYQYCLIISAIPEMWKFFLRTLGLIDNHTPRYEMIRSSSKVS